jgi:hypothetical protein
VHSTYLSPFVQHTIALATLLTATPRSRPPASHSYTQTRPHRPATTCSLHLNLAYCTHRHDHRPYVQRTHLDLLSASLHSSLVPTARAPFLSCTPHRVKATHETRKPHGSTSPRPHIRILVQLAVWSWLHVPPIRSCTPPQYQGHTWNPQACNTNCSVLPRL